MIQACGNADHRPAAEPAGHLARRRVRRRVRRRLSAAIQRFAPPLPLAVAFSGGADSTALLLACAERWPGQVVAIHVHHGLQSAADAFVLQCEKPVRSMPSP